MNITIDQLHPLVLNVGLAIHNGDWNWKNIISPFMRIYYVTSGEAQIILPSLTIKLKPDHLYFIPAFTKHTCVCNSNFSHYYIHIYEDNQETISLFENLEFPIEIKANELDLLIIKELCDMNPLMKLPQSDPSSYDNNPTLMENIIKNRKRDLFKKIESRGIIYK